MLKPHIAPKTQTAGFMVFSSLMLLVLSTVILALFLNRLQIREESANAPTRKIQDLVALLKQADTRRVSLEQEVSKLRKRLLDLEQNQKPHPYSKPSQDPELKKLYEMAGFTAIAGVGVVVTMEDSVKKLPANDAHGDPNAGKLQADDILKLVNELKAAGATAISINDQRLVVTSEIVSSGPTISVNQTRLTQPVVVKAIGDPELLINALKIRGGILEYLDFFEIKISVTKKDKVTIPPYKGPL